MAADAGEKQGVAIGRRLCRELRADTAARARTVVDHHRLAKIGTAGTVEPLRRVLKEGDSELRALVAGSIGRASRALAMPLVALIEAEQDPAVVREYYCALGRIGSPDALLALTRAAAPGGVGRMKSHQYMAAKPTAMATNASAPAFT